MPAQLASGRATGQSRAHTRGCVRNCPHTASHTHRNAEHSLIPVTRMFGALLRCRPGARSYTESQPFLLRHFPDSPPPPHPATHWEQKHYVQNGDCLLMHWPWEVRGAVTEQVQAVCQNRG